MFFNAASCKYAQYHIHVVEVPNWCASIFICTAVLVCGHVLWNMHSFWSCWSWLVRPGTYLDKPVRRNLLSWSHVSLGWERTIGGCQSWLCVLWVVQSHICAHKNIHTYYTPTSCWSVAKRTKRMLVEQGQQAQLQAQLKEVAWQVWSVAKPGGEGGGGRIHQREVFECGTQM